MALASLSYGRRVPWATGIVTILRDSQSDLRGLQQDNAGQHPHNEAEGNLDFVFLIEWPVQAGQWPFVYCRRF
jgi:hypothetical protein